MDRAPLCDFSDLAQKGNVPVELWPSQREVVTLLDTPVRHTRHGNARVASLVIMHVLADQWVLVIEIGPRYRRQYFRLWRFWLSCRIDDINSAFRGDAYRK